VSLSVVPADAARIATSRIPTPSEIDVDWVFAYGSLIWDPGDMAISHVEPGLVRGYHRSFCILSTLYRGTPQEPGLVLGLDRGGSCMGMAQRLDPSLRRESLEHLFSREMPAESDRVYLPRIVQVRLSSGPAVRALAFVADRSLPTYARLSDEEILALLGRCHGRRGPNRDYAINTWEALRRHGVRDERLAAIARRLRESPC
jgi:cation transport protein ChaC